jgi:hypothetical protein
MVHVTADAGAADRARELLVRMDGDTDRLWTLLGVDR